MDKITDSACFGELVSELKLYMCVEDTKARSLTICLQHSTKIYKKNDLSITKTNRVSRKLVTKITTFHFCP